MRFLESRLAGVWIVEPELHTDARGSFARIWCAREFGERGLETGIAQCALSVNRRRGTLRGLHYQAPPWEETKLVRCVRGALWDVVVDLRPGSPTYLRHRGVELTAENRRALYVPAGCAHGFQTLEDDTEVLYQLSTPYVPEAARGLRWDDPGLAIRWPLEPTVLSDRDRSFPDHDPLRHPAAR